MTEKEFERAKYLDNEIKYLKGIKREIELPHFDKQKIESIRIRFSYGQEFYLNEQIVKHLFGLLGLQSDLKKYLDERIPVLEAEFKQLVSDE